MEYRISLSGEDPTEAARAPVSGVGLLRSEFILRDRMTTLADTATAECLQDYVDRVAQAFSGRPVWYRTTDLWSDEAALLEGGDLKEPEANPLLGLRGVRRSLREKDLLKREFDLLCQVALEQPNLHLLFPFVADADEFREAAHLAREQGWPNRLGSMIEVPSAVFEVPRLAEAGATNLLVGLNDLACLVLGRERGQNNMKLHNAVWRLINAVRQSAPANVEWGIGGSLSAEVIQRAQESGAHYATIHYAELPALLHVDSAELPDIDLVKKVKQKNREAKQALAIRRARQLLATVDNGCDASE